MSTKRDRKRQRQATLLRERVKQLRQLGAPYTPGQGYDLRSLSDWSPQQKAAITRSYESIKTLLSRETVTKIPRKKENLNALKEAYNKDAPKWLNRVFIPTDDPGQPHTYRVGKKRYNKKTKKYERKVTVKTPQMTRHVINLDIEGLATDPVNTILETFDPFKENDIFVIRAGEWYSRFGGKRDDAANALYYLRTTYSADKYDKNNPSSSYWKNWLSEVEYLGDSDEPDADGAEWVDAMKKSNKDLKKKLNKGKSKNRNIKGKLKRKKKKKPSHKSDFLK